MSLSISQWCILIFGSFLTFSTVLLNGLKIYQATNYFDGIVRPMRKITSIFIMSNAIADFVVGVYVIPLAVTQRITHIRIVLSITWRTVHISKRTKSFLKLFFWKKMEFSTNFVWSNFWNQYIKIFYPTPE